MTRQYFIKKIGANRPPEKKVLDDQDAYDIITRMMIKHKKCAGDYDKIAADFAGGSTYDICQKLWDFCKRNLVYHEESLDRQNVSSPQTILARGSGDCKSYALFIAGVLDALNRQGYRIRWKYRFASDDIFSDIPGHVFIVVTDNGQEIWVDPVLSEFNQDHWYPYWEDKKITGPANMAGCGCTQTIGATVSQTGQLISKIAPALATVPVVGWAAAAVGEVVGGLLTIFGSRYNYDADQRDLLRKYQYYVLGDKSVTNISQVNENLMGQAQTWFTYVMGVPIQGSAEYHALTGTDSKNNRIPGITTDQKARNYLVLLDIWQGLSPNPNYSTITTKYGITESDIDQATYQAAQFNESSPAGGWAGFTVAPSMISKATGITPQMSGSYVDGAGNLISTPTVSMPVSMGSNQILLLTAAAAVAILILM